MICMENFSKIIEQWNEKLNALAGEYTDSPWAGALIFLLLFVFACWAISSLTKK